MIFSAAFALGLLVLLVTNSGSSRAFIFTCGLGMPLMVLGVTVGFNLIWFSFIGAVALLLAPLGRRQSGEYGGKVPLVGLFILYVVAVSGLWMILEYGLLQRYQTAKLLGLGVSQTIFKMPIQLASLVFQILAVFIAITRSRSLADASSAARGVYAGLVLSIVAGFISIALTGNGMVGVDRAVEVDLVTTKATRLGGLSGEPKMLGAFITIALMLALSRVAAPPAGGRRLPGSSKLLISLLGVSLFVTFSTSAWVGLIAGLAAMGLVLTLATKAKWARAWVAAALVTLVLSQVPVFRVAFDRRVDDRLLNSETAELEKSKDNYVFDVYKKKPYFVLTGFGLGGLDLEATPLMLHDPKYKAELQYVRTPTPSTNGMRFLGDIGLIGLALMALMVRRWYKELRSAGHLSGALFVVSGFVALMFISWNAISTYFFLAGAVLAEGRIMKRQREAEAAKLATLTPAPTTSQIPARQVA